MNTYMHPQTHINTWQTIIHIDTHACVPQSIPFIILAFACLVQSILFVTTADFNKALFTQGLACLALGVLDYALYAATKVINVCMLYGWVYVCTCACLAP